MTVRNSARAAVGVILGILLVGASVVLRQTLFAPTTITAFFTSVTGVYPGDEVRVSGVRVGTIDTIQPVAPQVKVTLHVDHGVPIPTDVKAVIVAQNLVAARYIQLTPAYETTGPTMADGAVIPSDRTAVPVEWDEVKAQLKRLATALGPSQDVSGTAVSHFLDSAATALDGKGPQLRQTIAQLSGLGRILSDGSANIVTTIDALQKFVTALRDSGVQIVSVQDRLATLSSVLDASKSDLDSVLKALPEVATDVRRFVSSTRDLTAEQISRLTDVTKNLVDHQSEVENVLHVTPNALANAYNIYNPDTGSVMGSFDFNNLSNPLQFICGAIGALENVTATETGKLCAQYLGPAARLANFNYLPFPVNAYLSKSASPENIIYSDPRLAPGGGGTPPGPPESPPTVSAYTGLNGDIPPPPGYGPPPGPPPNTGLPAAASPALFPGAPIPPAPAGPPTLQDMLLPAEIPPNASPPATEGAPAP
jgi:virulence factor Mce-like protein